MGLVKSLRKRGRGRRESGAFLLGKSDTNGRHVEAVAYYDELDPRCLDFGNIEFHAAGYSALWDLCEKRGLKVIADVHTHPGGDVHQSHIDREHPMIPVEGHVALILPHFGAASGWSLADVGLYVFGGNRRWTSSTHNAPDSPVRLCLW